MLVCDTGSHRIQEIDKTTGKVRASIGGHGIYEGKFVHPRGVASLGSNIIVADTSSNRLQVLDGSTHAFVRSMHTWSSDLEEAQGQRFKNPFGLAASGRRLLVSSDHQVQCFSLGPMMSLLKLADRIRAERRCGAMEALLRVMDERLEARAAEHKELRQKWESSSRSALGAAEIEVWRAQHEGHRARVALLRTLCQERRQ